VVGGLTRAQRRESPWLVPAPRQRRSGASSLTGGLFQYVQPPPAYCSHVPDASRIGPDVTPESFSMMYCVPVAVI
jgi:hypothetical protein